MGNIPGKFCHVLRDKSVFTIMTSKGVEMNIMIEYSSILFLKDGLLFSKSQKTPHLQDYRFYVIGTINIQ